MEDQVFVQSISISMKTPAGKKVTSKFTGLAICTPKEWDDIKNNFNNLGEALEGDQPIQFSDPKPIDELIGEGSEQHDIIDSLRNELRQNHHQKLKE